MAVVTPLITLFIMIGIGYFLGHKNILKQKETTMLSSLVMKVGIPGMLIASVKNGSPMESSSLLFQDLFYVFLLHLLLVLAAFLTAKLIRSSKQDQSVYEYMFIFGNAAFLGFPVIIAVLGEDKLVYSAVFLLIQGLFLYSYGIYLMNKNDGFSFSWKQLITPSIIASIIAFVLCLLDVKLPQVIADSAAYLGSITTPLGMLIIGASLSDIDVSEILHPGVLTPFIIIKQILFPIIVYIALRAVNMDEAPAQVYAIMTAMPIATVSIIMASEYRHHVAFTSKAVFISTLASFLTVPCVSACFEWL